jgi:insertion element IS1 protein InsB
VPRRRLARSHAEEVTVVIRRADEAEVDERWSLVGKKCERRWLWQAMDHRRGHGWAAVFGRRNNEVVLKRKVLLEPCGMPQYDMDSGGAYPRHCDADEPQPGTRTTQPSERKPRTWRTRLNRLARKTIGLSTSIQRHERVSGLCVKRSECGLQV